MSAATIPAPTAGQHRPRLVSAEILKITSTKMWLWMIIGVVGYIGIGVVASIFAPAQPGVEVPTLQTEPGMRNLFAQAGGAYIFAIVIGTLGMTQELRHQTITSTFLAEPRRNAVMLAKMVAYAFVGAFYGLVGVVFGYGLALALLPLKDHADIPWDSLAQIAGGAVLGSALFAVLGVAVGALVRNQIAAVLGVLVWVLLIEQLVVVFLPDIGKWLPGGALSGVLQTTGFNNTEYLPVWGGALVLLAWTAVLGGIAALTTQKRDVT
jgi:ABC-type transport system involved in multi-copper enzyme maturation permease subunit